MKSAVKRIVRDFKNVPNPDFITLHNRDLHSSSENHEGNPDFCIARYAMPIQIQIYMEPTYFVSQKLHFSRPKYFFTKGPAPITFKKAAALRGRETFSATLYAKVANKIPRRL